MNPIGQFTGLENAVLPPRPLHLAIGRVDGVHLGHRAVIEAVTEFFSPPKQALIAAE